MRAQKLETAQLDAVHVPVEVAAHRRDGSVAVEQKWIPNDDLKAHLEEIHSQTPDKSVVIKADKRLKYKEVRKVMQVINEAGFSRVGVVTEKEKKLGGAA